MTATSTLRRHLDECGIQYRDMGQLATRIRHDGITWMAEDNLDGTLRLRTDVISPHMITGVMGRIATIERDGDYAECGSCHRSIGPQFHYCPWCGSRFE